MKRINNLTVFVGLILASIASSCTDINSLHEPYLKQGEKIYIGKIDSVHMFAGHDRAVADIWFSDNRAKNLVVKYNGGVDSVIIPLTRDPAHMLRTDPVRIEIPDTKESSFSTFTFITYDGNMRYKSLSVESICSSYGADYIESILNRRISSFFVNEEGALAITWLRSTSSQIVETEVYYIDASTDTEQKFIVRQNENSCLITNVKIGSTVRYRTVYRPEATAIDLFYTPFESFDAVE